MCDCLVVGLISLILLFVFIFKQKELFKEQKMRSRLEESVARAAEDAQMQINTHAMTNNKLEKLLAGLGENFEATKHGAQTHIVSLSSCKSVSCATIITNCPKFLLAEILFFIFYRVILKINCIFACFLLR